MNKKLLTMAVGAALAMSAVAAQAEVTVYGQLQAELGSVDHERERGVGDPTKLPTDVDSIEDEVHSDAATGNKMDDNKRGRLGIKAAEDLGAGLTGIAGFEWQVETTQGQVDDGPRTSFVGLKGGFGTVKIGALKTAYKYTGGVKYDPFVATFLEARSNGGMLGKGLMMPGVMNGNTDVFDELTGGLIGGGKLDEWQDSVVQKYTASSAFGQHSFMTDSLSYQNKFGPVALWVNYGFDEFGGAKGADGDYHVSLKFSGGNFEAFVAAAHDDELKVTSKGLSKSANDTADIDDIAGIKREYRATYDATKFGGQFKMKAGGMSHTISAQVENFEIEDDGIYDMDDDQSPNTYDTKDLSAPVDGTNEGMATFVSYTLGMGKTSFVAQFGVQEQEIDGGTPGAGSIDDLDITTEYTAIGVIHKFSKKTRIFGGLRETTNEWDYFDFPGVYDDEDETTVYSVGMRMDF